MAKSFADFKFNKQLLTAIAEAGYERPSETQEKILGPAMSGQDLIGIAPTGTGKTAAYVLPMLRKLGHPRENEMRALVLAPTRELAVQIGDHIRSLAVYTGLRCVVIYGGVGSKAQKEEIRQGLDILVATPGRLMDIYLEGHLVVKRLQYMVIDEADKMMDMGFMPAINRILEILPRKRQNLLFSATFPPKVERLSEDFLKFPLKIEIRRQATPAKTVRQQLFYVPNLKTKINLLMHVLGSGQSGEQVIVFCKTKNTATNIGKYLSRKHNGEHIRVIHGNKAQNTRLNAINDFRAGAARVLVTTDVVARGIDIFGVSLVVNFDVPLVYEDYVHRIGRTGRMEAAGEALTFCSPAEVYHIRKIEGIIRQPIPAGPLPEEVDITATPFAEAQAMAREIDYQKRKDDPEYKGAFHEKTGKSKK